MSFNPTDWPAETTPAPRWRRLLRRARPGLLGVLLASVAVLPFPAAATLSAEGPSPGIVQTAARASVQAPAHPRQSASPAPTEDLSTLERLLATQRPARDPIALASRVTGTSIPWTATQPLQGPLAVGQQDTFYVLDQNDNSYKVRSAVLRYVSRSAYWYVQDGQSVDEGDLARAASQFDEQTVPTVHRVFGSEWSPGIDGDTRVTIFLGTVPGVSAYFSSWDEYPRSVYRYSNEREMIHVNLSATRPGGSSFDGTLAHEFQHMVHWNLSRTDDTWLDEGFAELASALAIPGRPPSTASFQRQPNVQLTAWSQTGQSGLHYQASYLFSRYFLQRFGEQAPGQLLTEPGRPTDTLTAFFSRAGYGVTFDDVFEDWLIANLLDDHSILDGRYGYTGIDHQAAIALSVRPDGRPADDSVHQYGARYIELSGDGAAADLTFEGASTARLVGADPTSGRQLWWTNRGDGLDSTLTRTVDLRGVSSASLRFNLWYETEADFDFLYVMASTDGGARWQVLHGANAENENPTGNAVGPGYSGASGDPNSRRAEPTWLSETVDLTPLAGAEVLLRFEYVTDQGFNGRGALLDDISIPEIGFLDDAEADAGWQAGGFLRSDNTIPQTWSLQLVEQRRGGETRVRPLRTDAQGRLTERIAGLGGEIERAVLVISGLAPRTLEPASYRLTLRPAP